ncbi:hypothetical protein GIB67_013627 [Kingdonia uniflora]|uniref:Uncharacterized protein n=1 Tax=Kingdonia uniflora TaxID=39325 RepID=A0A7J7NPQ9_9MAGN|nr:hypothetical protein GIB67_013627 [Kingdonia uniflora]
MEGQNSGYLYSDSTRPKFFDFESAGRSWYDRPVWVEGNCNVPEFQGSVLFPSDGFSSLGQIRLYGDLGNPYVGMGWIVGDCWLGFDAVSVTEIQAQSLSTVIVIGGCLEYWIPYGSVVSPRLLVVDGLDGATESQEGICVSFGYHALKQWQVVSGFSCCCGDLWGAELEAHSPVVTFGLAA